MNHSLSLQSRNRSVQTTFRLGAILGFMTFLVFLGCLKCQFINYDDPVFVTQHTQIQRGLNLESLSWAFKSLYIYWQPLTWISYMVDFQVAGKSPTWYHFVNLVLHICSSVLLFATLCRLTNRPFRCFVVAALFAIHPLHVETVVWISERKGVLSGFFWILTLFIYSRYTRKANVGNYLLVVAAFALSLMSKSVGVTLPCVMLLLDYWPLNRVRPPTIPNSSHPTATAFSLKQAFVLVLEKLPLLAMAGVSSYLTVAAQRQMGAFFSTASFSFQERLTMAVISYGRYLKKFFLPTDLAVFYPITGKWTPPEVTVSATVLITLLLWSLIAARKRPYLLVGFLMFIGITLPVSGLLQTGEQLMADRYSYLPLIGMSLAGTWYICELLQDRMWSVRSRMLLCAAGLAYLGVFTVFQVSRWVDTKTLFEHTLKVTSDNYLAHTVMGSILGDEGNLSEASRHFEKALLIQPGYAETHSRYAIVLRKAGAFLKAIPHLEATLSVDPGNLQAMMDLLDCLLRTGQTASAISESTRFLERGPAKAGILRAFALIFNQYGVYDHAVRLYKEIAAMPGPSPDVLNNLAWILATHSQEDLRNPAIATGFAEEACKITERKVPVFLGTLAAAYAASGRFDEAVRVAAEASQLALSLNQSDVAKRNEELADQYRRHEALRLARP